MVHDQNKTRHTAASETSQRNITAFYSESQVRVLYSVRSTYPKHPTVYPCLHVETLGYPRSGGLTSRGQLANDLDASSYQQHFHPVKARLNLHSIQNLRASSQALMATRTVFSGPNHIGCTGVPRHSVRSLVRTNLRRDTPLQRQPPSGCLQAAL